jgi:hypothetical protein
LTPVEHLSEPSAFRANLRLNPRELMLHRLKIAHPGTDDESLLLAIDAAKRLEREAGKPPTEADWSELPFVARARDKCPGFEEKTCGLAYAEFRIAYR